MLSPRGNVLNPGSPLSNLSSEVFFASKSKGSSTVSYPGTVIARAFQKPKLAEGIISKVLMANASAFCAAALPEINEEEKL